MMRNAVWLLLATVLVVAIVVAATLVPGCGRDPSQTTVVPPDQIRQTGLTPLQRGQLRKQILRAVTPAIKAWSESDISAMRKYFSKDLADYNAKLKADYARQGRARVRKHANVFLDVVDMTPTGRQASIQYTFTNRSYFASKSTGRPVSKPSNKRGEIDLTVERQGGRWVILRMFSSKDELL